MTLVEALDLITHEQAFINAADGIANLLADARRDERIKVLRELAAELESAARCADTPGGMPTPWGYSDPCEFSTFISVFLARADALEKGPP